MTPNDVSWLVAENGDGNAEHPVRLSSDCRSRPNAAFRAGLISTAVSGVQRPLDHKRRLAVARRLPLAQEREAHHGATCDRLLPTTRIMDSYAVKLQASAASSARWVDPAQC